MRRSLPALVLLGALAAAGCSRSRRSVAPAPTPRTDPFAAAWAAGRWEEAERIQRERLRALPDDPGLRTDLAAALAQQKRYAESERELRRVVTAHPDFALAHFNLGTVLAAGKRDEDAVPELETAVRLNPEAVGALRNLANARLRLGRSEGAIEAYRRVIDLEPASGEARLGEAIALAQKGDWEKALARIEDGRRAFPDLETLVAAQAKILAACPVDRLRDGRRAFSLAGLVSTKAGFSSSQVVEAAAMAHAEMGAFDEAIKLQELLVASLERQGDDASFQKENLLLYRSGRPCRRPFPELAGSKR